MLRYVMSTEMCDFVLGVGFSSILRRVVEKDMVVCRMHLATDGINLAVRVEQTAERWTKRRSLCVPSFRLSCPALTSSRGGVRSSR